MANFLESLELAAVEEGEKLLEANRAKLDSLATTGAVSVKDLALAFVKANIAKAKGPFAGILNAELDGYAESVANSLVAKAGAGADALIGILQADLRVFAAKLGGK